MTENLTAYSEHSSETDCPTTQITGFPMEVDADEAATRLAATDTEIVDVSIEDCLYYPYHVATYRVEVDALFNSFDEEIDCGVDLRSGTALLVDDLGAVDVTVPTDAILPAEYDETGDEVMETTRSYITEVAHRRLTIGRSMDLTRLESTRRYRPFHLAICETVDGNEFTYIVDGVSADFHRVYR